MSDVRSQHAPPDSREDEAPVDDGAASPSAEPSDGATPPADDGGEGSGRTPPAEADGQDGPRDEAGEGPAPDEPAQGYLDDIAALVNDLNAEDFTDDGGGDDDLDEQAINDMLAAVEQLEAEGKQSVEAAGDDDHTAAAPEKDAVPPAEASGPVDDARPGDPSAEAPDVQTAPDPPAEQARVEESAAGRSAPDAQPTSPSPPAADSGRDPTLAEIDAALADDIDGLMPDDADSIDAMLDALFESSAAIVEQGEGGSTTVRNTMFESSDDASADEASPPGKGEPVGDPAPPAPSARDALTPDTVSPDEPVAPGQPDGADLSPPPAEPGTAGQPGSVSSAGGGVVAGVDGGDAAEQAAPAEAVAGSELASDPADLATVTAAADPPPMPTGDAPDGIPSAEDFEQGGVFDLSAGDMGDDELVENAASGAAADGTPDLQKIWQRKVRPIVQPIASQSVQAVRALLKLSALPLAAAPPKVRAVVSWIALTLVFWVPLVWVFALFFVG